MSTATPVRRATSPRKAALRVSLSTRVTLRRRRLGEHDGEDEAGETGAGAKIEPAFRVPAAPGARSWAESAKWRDQIASSVLGATRLMVFCHWRQQGLVSQEFINRFT